MVSVPVQCPHCHSSEVIKAGKQANGAQRYQCHNDRCARRIFLLQYQDRGRVPEVRRQVVDMAKMFSLALFLPALLVFFSGVEVGLLAAHGMYEATDRWRSLAQYLPPSKDRKESLSIPYATEYRLHCYRRRSSRSWFSTRGSRSIPPTPPAPSYRQHPGTQTRRCSG